MKANDKIDYSVIDNWIEDLEKDIEEIINAEEHCFKDEITDYKVMVYHLFSFKRKYPPDTEVSEEFPLWGEANKETVFLLDNIGALI